MSPAGVPHVSTVLDPETQEPVDIRALLFRKLPDDLNEWFWQVAEKKAELGICFMCKWIIDEVDHPWFPTPSQESHMMICCVPDRLRNLRLLGLTEADALERFKDGVSEWLNELEKAYGRAQGKDSSGSTQAG
jgi:hypothetical protein